jgi:outer membrane receptor protein involved in Fe transport
MRDTHIKDRRLQLTLIASTVVGSFASLPAQAQEAAAAAQGKAAAPEVLEEVVITSERRSSTVQKTAASITVKNGKSMAEAGQTSLSQMLEDVPGVSIGSSGGATTDSLGASVVVRGVQPDTLAGGASSPAPTTAVYIDGVFNGIGGDYDVARMEVLRGPQGTLYGRSATSGVVSIITNNPELKHSGGDILLEGGTAGLKHGTGVANIALGDTVALRVAVNDFQRDGFYSKDGGYARTRSQRAKLLFKPSEDFSLLLGAAAQRQDVHSGGLTMTATGPTRYAKSESTVADQQYTSKQYWGQMDWNLGWAGLTWIPSYRSWETHGLQNISGIIEQANNYPKDSFVTQELRLTSKDSGPLKWLVGAFYYNNEYQNKSSATWIASQALVWEQNIEKSTKNLGLFGESTWSLRPDTRLTAGLRVDTTRSETSGYYTANSTTATDTATSPTMSGWGLPESLSTATLTREQGRLSLHNTTFKLRVEHDLAPSNAVYAIIASGFLPGDSQFTKTASGATAMPYDQQKLMSYEIGSKNRFLDGQLTVNASLYYYDYSGFQTTANTSGNPSDPAYAVVTSAARMGGAELEARWRLSPSDALSLSYAHTSARYVDSNASFKTYVAQTRIPGIAPNTATLGYDHVFSIAAGSLRAHADARLQSAYSLAAQSVADTTTYPLSWNRAGSATFVNANLSWDSPDGIYTVTGYVRNITDKKVRSSFLPSDASITLSDPRTFGVVLQAHF